MNIARLHVPTYEEVEADVSATTEAAFVLVVTGLIGGLGTLITNGGWAFLVWVAATIGGWFVWAFASVTIAERFFGVQTTDLGEMLRVIGYGSAPRVLGVIPFLGFFALIWTLIVLVVGIRQAGEMTTGQAAITAVVGLVPTLVAYGLITVLF